MAHRCVALGLCTIVVAMGGASSDSHAQTSKTEHILALDDPAKRPAATIDELAWLTGAWRGEGLGGQVEETWSAPSGGTMVGTFKLTHDGNPSMYEIELLAEEDGSLVWKVKHFGADLVAWEDKESFTRFPLVKLTDEAAYFDGVTLARDGPDGLKIYLTMKRDGKVTEELLELERVR